jgi:hypothetical protein
MKVGEPIKKSWAISRRSLLRGLGVTGIIAALPGTGFLNSLSSTATRRGPVVAFHMDQLYVDWTGTAAEYIPPVGLRSAEILAQLSDEQLRWNFTYI